MKGAGAFTRALAAVGAALAWFPIAATVLLAAAGLFGGRPFRFDYLMPAELFPFALAGGALLLWAALRARARRGLIGWGMAAMILFLFGGQGLAVATGLASGETEPAGWPWVLVLASIAAYSLAVVEVAWAGALLVRDLFRGERRGGRARLAGRAE